MTPWFAHQPAHADLTVVCMHPAGSGASAFAAWRRFAPSGCEVCAIQLPGREGRVRSERLKIYSHVLAHLRHEVLPVLIGRQFVLYGHSLGAWLAWDLGLMLEAAGCPPLGLIVGAQRAPRLGYPLVSNSELDDAAFLLHLRGLGLLLPETMDDVLLANLVLPLMRDDLALCETRALSEDVANFPVLALSGSRDCLVAAEDVLAWRCHVASDFRHEFVDAGHMFLRTHSAELCARVLAEAQGWAACRH